MITGMAGEAQPAAIGRDSANCRPPAGAAGVVVVVVDGEGRLVTVGAAASPVSTCGIRDGWPKMNAEPAAVWFASG
jgi:hypothetical protein